MLQRDNMKRTKSWKRNPLLHDAAKTKEDRDRGSNLNRRLNIRSRPSLAFNNARRISDRFGGVAVSIVRKFKNSAIVVSSALINHAGDDCRRKPFQFATQLNITHCKLPKLVFGLKSDTVAKS